MSEDSHHYPRGSIVLVKFDSPSGRRQKAVLRPCVIATDAEMVRRSPTPLTYGVVPLTTGSTAAEGELAIRLLPREGSVPAISIALCIYVRMVASERIVGHVGQLNAIEMREIGTGLKSLFGIEDQIVPESWRKWFIGELLHSKKTDSQFRQAMARLYEIDIKPYEP